MSSQLLQLDRVGIWIGIIIGIPTILYNIYKYRNLPLILLKWCKTICKNIATTYKNIKAKIRKHWEKRVGIEDKNKEIEALKQQHKEELAKKDEEIEALEKTGRKHLADANTIIGSLYEPPRNARDFLYDIRDRKGFEAFYLQDFCYITYTNRNNFTYTIAKISYISNNSKDFNAKTHVSIKQILEEHREILKEHKNNIETLTYEPPHLPTNHR